MNGYIERVPKIPGDCFRLVFVYTCALLCSDNEPFCAAIFPAVIKNAEILKWLCLCNCITASP